MLKGFICNSTPSFFQNIIYSTLFQFRFGLFVLLDIFQRKERDSASRQGLQIENPNNTDYDNFLVVFDSFLVVICSAIPPSEQFGLQSYLPVKILWVLKKPIIPKEYSNNKFSCFLDSFLMYLLLILMIDLDICSVLKESQRIFYRVHY